MSEADLPAGVLGETTGTLEIDQRDQVAALSLALAQQARRTLDIVSRHLDPALYDNDAFATAVKDLVLGSRYARVRLFIVDSRPLVTQGHRVLELASRLSSFIHLRAPAAQHRNFNEALLIADNLGYVHRQFSDRFEATGSFADRRRALALCDRVDELWERAQPDTNFRRLHL